MHTVIYSVEQMCLDIANELEWYKTNRPNNITQIDKIFDRLQWWTDQHDKFTETFDNLLTYLQEQEDIGQDNQKAREMAMAQLAHIKMIKGEVIEHRNRALHYKRLNNILFRQLIHERTRWQKEQSQM